MNTRRQSVYMYTLLEIVCSSFLRFHEVPRNSAEPLDSISIMQAASRSIKTAWDCHQAKLKKLLHNPFTQ